MKMQINLSTIVFLAVGSFSFQGESQSFRSGNEFKSIPIYGSVSVRCMDSTTGQVRSALFDCQDVYLTPAEYDYFVGPKIDADQVSLSSVRDNGSVISKSSGYKNGQSVNRFNLWLVSLLQQPLLKEGQNSVNYKLLKNGSVVAEGTFIATISREKARVCPDGFINSNNSLDCESPYSACEQYFSQYSCQ